MPVNAGSIAKRLRGGLLQIAIEIALEGVDYLLDPDNNRIHLNPKGSGAYVVNGFYGVTAQQACQRWLDSINIVQVPHYKDVTTKATGVDNFGYCNVWGGTLKYNGNIGATWNTEMELSHGMLYAQLINKANQGNPKAQQLITDIVLAQAQEGEFDGEFARVGIVTGVEENDGTEPPKKTCMKDFKEYKMCSVLRDDGFIYLSKSDALKSSGIIGSAPSKQDNFNRFCGKYGTHINYRPTKKTQNSRTPNFAGTISSCQCCQDSPNGAKITTTYKAN